MNDEEDSVYVERGGLAVVHQGEKIVAARDSEATLSRGGAGEVHYHFPVRVVVVGDVSESLKSEIEARIWDGLNAALA